MTVTLDFTNKDMYFILKLYVNLIFDTAHHECVTARKSRDL